MNYGYGRSARVFAGMGVGKPFADAREDVKQEPERRMLAQFGGTVEERPQVFAVNVLEGDEPLAVDATVVEAPRDVRVLELRDDASLVLEHLDELFVGGGL